MRDLFDERLAGGSTLSERLRAGHDPFATVA
jgi:hypothetical protein